METAAHQAGEPKSYDYEYGLFLADMDDPCAASQIDQAAPPPDAQAYLVAMQDAARAGVPFNHYSDEQLDRLEIWPSVGSASGPTSGPGQTTNHRSVFGAAGAR